MSAVWIVFSGKADVRFLRILKPGFRHCFALIQSDDRWITVDPMLHRLDVTATHCAADFDLPMHLRAHGYRVVRAPVLRPRIRVAGLSPFTCVEAMKRLIGLQDWFVFTPWQLYRRLLSLTRFQGDHHGKPVFQA